MLGFHQSAASLDSTGWRCDVVFETLTSIRVTLLVDLLRLESLSRFYLISGPTNLLISFKTETGHKVFCFGNFGVSVESNRSS